MTGRDIRAIAALLMTVMFAVSACGPRNQTAGKVAEHPSSEETSFIQEEESTDGEAGREQEEPEMQEYDNGTEEEHEFALYSLGGDRIADVSVPKFLTYVDYSRNYIMARDDESYDATYIFCGAWTSDKFFETKMEDIDGLDEEIFTKLQLSDAESIPVNGHDVVWKKLTGVYNGDIHFSEYYAAVETDKNGVIGVVLTSVESGEDDDKRLMEMLSGITF